MCFPYHKIPVRPVVRDWKQVELKILQSSFEARVVFARERAFLRSE